MYGPGGATTPFFHLYLLFYYSLPLVSMSMGKHDGLEEHSFFFSCLPMLCSLGAIDESNTRSNVYLRVRDLLHSVIEELIRVASLPIDRGSECTVERSPKLASRSRGLLNQTHTCFWMRQTKITKVLLACCVDRQGDNSVLVRALLHALVTL